MNTSQGTGLDKNFKHALPSAESAYKICLEAEEHVPDGLKMDATLDAEKSNLRRMLKACKLKEGEYYIYLLRPCKSRAL